MRSAIVRQVLLFLTFVLPALPFVTGCNAPKDQLTKFNRYFEAGDYQGSCEFAGKHLKQRKKPQGEDLLWALQLGTLDRLLGKHTESNAFFDESEDMLKFYDEQSRLGDGLATTAINENALPYRGEVYDGIMINTYKALNFMSLGDMELARVEFNRALDRQRRAKEIFNKEIQKHKEQISKEARKKPLVQSNVDNPKTKELLAKKYPNLYAFDAYPDFVNPFATYLAGIFFALDGDYSKANTLLKESYGMVTENQYIAEDLMVTEQILDGGQTLNDTVWVIFENGLGPIRKEFRLDIPLFVATRHVRYVGIALPKLEFRTRAYPHLLAEADGNIYKTRLVANMDRIIQTEFKKDFDVILQRAIVSATVKALAQYAFESDNSSAGTTVAIVVAAYSFATNAADVRVWTTLPKDFQVARFQKPGNGMIKITPPGGTCFEVELENCSNAIIYVRIPTKLCPPVYEVMTF